MEQILSHGLSTLGCGEKHIRFYVANLQLGASGIQDIAKKARLQRSTAYIIASELITLGLVSEDHKTYGKLFVATDPDSILAKLETKRRYLDQQVSSLKEALPELRAAHQITNVRPRVRTVEGQKGLMTIWKDLLRNQQEILLWTNQASERQFFPDKSHELFIRERIRRNIPIRVLAVDNKEGRELQLLDKEQLRTTKLLPAAYTFSSETYMYGNKVAVLDISSTVFGMITENLQIAESQRTLFELGWNLGK